MAPIFSAARIRSSQSRWLALAILFCLGTSPQLVAQTVQDVAQRLNLSVAETRNLQQLSGYPVERLALLSSSNVPRLIRRIRYPDIQRRRMEFEARQYNLDGAAPPVGAVSRAADQFRQLQLNTRRPLAAGIPVGQPEVARGQPLFAGISADGWKWLGPGNVGGRTRAMVIHPDKPGTIWAGSTGGGVWRSDNGGEVWHPLDNGMSNLVITCLAMMPGNPNCLVAGTGEHTAESDWMPGELGDGLFITRDGGDTWQQLAATVREDFDFVRQVAFSPDGKALLAATRLGIFRSTDLGTSWTKTGAFSGSDVEFHPTNPQEALASGMYDGLVHFSADGGLHWTAADMPNKRLPPGEGRVEFAYARANPAVVYAMINTQGGMLGRSSNGGRSFTLIDVSAYQVFGPYSQGQYDNVMWAGDPTNADFVIVGGIDLFKSVNGGKTLSLISNWGNPESVHADQHCIVSHPKFDGVSNKTVYFGSDGGIYKTDDVHQAGSDIYRARGWVSLNKSYGTTLFYSVAGNPHTGTLIAGAQDNGTLRYTEADGVNGWKTMIGGDGGFCAADPNDPTVFYGEYVFLELARSTPSGMNSYMLNGLREFSLGFGRGQNLSWKIPPYQIDDCTKELANFIAPFILDPNDSNRLLAGGLSLWRTNDAKAEITIDAGPAWTQIKAPLADPKEKYSLPLLISAIAVAPGNSDEIWVGHNNGEVWRTTNGTATTPEWNRVGEGALPQSLIRKNYWCKSITVSPHDNQRVFVTFTSHTRDNVWLTTNSGTTWKNVGAELPETGARTVAIHPQRPEYVYLGTDVGLFASEDGGLTWSPTNHGPANVRVEQLIWLQNRLVAATFGRGIYSIEVKP